MKKTSLLSCLAVTIVAVSFPVFADQTECVGILTGGTYKSIVVPAGATCSLIRAEVEHNVRALENSRLAIYLSDIQGSVEGHKAQVVQVRDSTVRKNIMINQGGVATPAVLPEALICFAQGFPLTPCDALVIGSTILEGNIHIQKVNGDVIVRESRILQGSVKLEDNFAPLNQPLIIDLSEVAQNVQVFNNEGPGAKMVMFNTIGDKVQCFANEAPVIGGPNVAPRKQGQCF